MLFVQEVIGRFLRTPAPTVTEDGVAKTRELAIRTTVDFAVICGVSDTAPLLNDPRLTEEEISRAGLDKAIATAKQDIPCLQARGIPVDEEDLIHLVRQRWDRRGDLVF